MWLSARSIIGGMDVSDWTIIYSRSNLTVSIGQIFWLRLPAERPNPKALAARAAQSHALHIVRGHLAGGTGKGPTRAKFGAAVGRFMGILG